MDGAGQLLHFQPPVELCTDVRESLVVLAAEAMNGVMIIDGLKEQEAEARVAEERQIERCIELIEKALGAGPDTGEWTDGKSICRLLSMSARGMDILRDLGVDEEHGLYVEALKELHEAEKADAQEAAAEGPQIEA
jgi:hypothetical protein